MRKRLVMLSLTLLLAAAGYCQSILVNAAANFIPSGYSLLQQNNGDLNLDNIPDLILVLRTDGEDTLSSPETPKKRLFLLLLGQPDNGFRLAAKNENVIYHFAYDANFREALVDIRLEKGSFSIDHYGGFARRWGRTTTFTYNVRKKDWYLSSDEWSSFDSMTGGDQKQTVYTPRDFGQVSLRTFNIYKKPTHRKSR